MEIKNLKGLNNNKFNFEIKAILSLAALLMLAIFTISIIKINQLDFNSPNFPFTKTKPVAGNISDIKKFSSEQDFKNYLEASVSLSGAYGGGIGGGQRMLSETMPLTTDMMAKNSENGIGGGGAPDRVSGTNVQVIGIDEPDIVKTDGKEIYFSGTQRYYYPMMREDVNGLKGTQEQIAPNSKIMMPPIPQQASTSIIRAFPPADLALDGKIDKQGELLLNNNILVVFPTQGYYGGKQEIIAYDVSSPKSPAKKWSIALESNTSIVASRMQNGKIHLIVRNNINQNRPCPIKPMSVDGVELNIKCADIYHPIQPIPIDSTFTAMALDSNTGKIKNTVSFAGSSGATVIYVSENAIYATYNYNESIVKFMSGFVNKNKDFFPATLVKKINRLNNYDISETSKLMEFSMIMEKYKNSLGEDEKLKLENEMNNRMSDYYKAHSRELEKTGIVKINTANFSVIASGAVPGHLLNNFSMDEYQGNLRVASTIGSRWGGFNGIGAGDSVSDVTILDKNLNFLGSVKDLGKTEQIYSVRFIEDKGYVVTFRQTDPFYVLDLANPKNPVLAGELKIPGYSSYLHPLDATHILGIGQEGSQVKISLFDVTDKANPAELDKYLLDEYWTEVSNNYHAFLLDTKHNIFFLPGSKGGYVFSYLFANKIYTPKCETGRYCPPVSKEYEYKLSLQKAVSQNSVKRAIYINDYLYIIGDNKITVLNELNWEKINELELNK